MKAPFAFAWMLIFAAATSWQVLHDRPHVPSSRKLALAGHMATYGLADALAAGTSIDVRWAWPSDVVWSQQRQVALTPDIARADAVVTMRAATPNDALFVAARAGNFHVIEIDATLDKDLRTTVVRSTANEFAPGAPLSPQSAMRMAESIAREFSQWSPEDAARCADNLRTVKERLFRMRASAEAKIAASENVDVQLNGDLFDALASDFGLAIRAKGDRDIRAVLTAYPLPASELRMLSLAGARVALLDSMASAPLHPANYFDAMQRNLDALTVALAP